MSTLDDFFDEKIKLPSPPAIAIKILLAIRQDENSFDELAQIIMADPALTTRVLKVANSSLYGIRGEIGNLSQATSLIGTNALRNIALSFVIIQNFKDTAQEHFDMEYFWRRAVTSAVAAEVLVEKLECKDPDIFVSALLQDMGVLLLFFSSPVEYTSMRDQKRIAQEATHISEAKFFGYNHAEVGGKLLQTWNLPDSIALPVRYHHSEKVKEPYRQSANIVRLGGAISSVFTGVHGSSKAIEVQKELLDEYGWATNQTLEVIDFIADKACEILRLYEIDPGETMPLSHIMQNAIDELGRLNLSYEQVVLELRQAKQNAEQLAVALKQTNDTLRELAFRDGLTGLYNHRYFQEALISEKEQSQKYDQPLSLMLLDIDYFKKVNDTYGHPIGDIVLQEVSNSLVSLVRKSDIVARYGGEEFTIILPETGISQAKVMAQRVRRGIEQLQIDIGDQQLSITISIGLVCAETDEERHLGTDLVGLGDQALYRAKQMGRNRVEIQQVPTTV